MRKNINPEKELYAVEILPKCLSNLFFQVKHCPDLILSTTLAAT